MKRLKSKSLSDQLRTKPHLGGQRFAELLFIPKDVQLNTRNDLEQFITGLLLIMLLTIAVVNPDAVYHL